MKQGFLEQKTISTVFEQQSDTSPVTWKIFHRYQYRSRVEVGCDPHDKSYKCSDFIRVVTALS